MNHKRQDSVGVNHKVGCERGMRGVYEMVCKRVSECECGMCEVYERGV